MLFLFQLVFGAKVWPDFVQECGILTSYCRAVVKTLGVMFDDGLNFDKQIDCVIRSSFYPLWLVAIFKPFLSGKDLEKAMTAFISSLIDYSNVLYLGINQGSLYRLQLAQNAAARLLTNARSHSHTKPGLYSHHWLPVHFRVDFKILKFVFKVVHGIAPSYLCNCLQAHRPLRALWLADQHVFEVPRSKST